MNITQKSGNDETSNPKMRSNETVKIKAIIMKTGSTNTPNKMFTPLSKANNKFAKKKNLSMNLNFNINYQTEKIRKSVTDSSTKAISTQKVY